MSGRVMVGIVAVIGVVSMGGAYAEMPEEPLVEDLISDANVVVAGEVLKLTDISMSINVEYRVVEFQVCSVYKQCSEVYPPIGEETADSNSDSVSVFSVIVQSSGMLSDHLKPDYQVGKKYILFLEPTNLEVLFYRSDLDYVWEERPWNEEVDREIKTIIRRQAAGIIETDNIGYTIPEEAAEKVVPLTKWDHENNYSKKAEYWLDGEMVGKRTWSNTGKLVSEKPLKKGRRHGAVRGWYSNGRPWQFSYFKNGKMHGPYEEWNEQGEKEVAFWVNGNPVTKRAYLEAMEADPSLPRVEEGTEEGTQ